MAIGRRRYWQVARPCGSAAPAILRAQSSSKVHVSHGFAMHGEPKYGPDAGPPDYLNPDAPKGGTVRFGARGTFDSLHPFIVKSVPAAGVSAIWDPLCWSSRDEAFDRIRPARRDDRMPEDRSWVAFTLRPQARWHDGSADHGRGRDLHLRHPEVEGRAQLRASTTTTC